VKLSPRDASAIFAKPDTNRAAMLIYGQDAMRVALKRQEFLENLLGKSADEEMRLTRIAGADLRRDPSALQDAVRAVGFFPGQRAVLVDEATDGLSDIIAAAIDSWAPGDAMIVATAGSLAARSGLRKLFEGSRSALCVAIYDNPPSRQEIEAELTKVGLSRISPEATQDIEALSRALDPGDFRQTLEKIAVYKIGDASPLSSAEVMMLAPATIEAELDDLLNAVADGQAKSVGLLMSKLAGQGINAVLLCITATRHFRALHAASSDPKGAAAGIARAKPPIFGPRRDKMVQQADGWGQRRLEMALPILIETDLLLRSAGQTAPQLAVIERMFIRLSMLRNARL
jgi:DNA polymerase-3 subunit delta